MKETTLTAYLVDDEKAGLTNLAWMLAEYCPKVEVTGSYENSQLALEALRQNQPDVLFLDINMPRYNGFELLTALAERSLQVVFTTAYEDYALEAFRVNATDYLLKPIDSNDLISAVEKCRQRMSRGSEDQHEIIRQLKAHIPGRQQSLIRVPSQKGFDLYAPEEIIYCQSESNYTNVHLANGSRKLISKTLKDITELLPSSRFFRIHQSYLVNLSQVRSFQRDDGGCVIMSNGDRLRIARRHRSELLEQLGNFCEG